MYGYNYIAHYQAVASNVATRGQCWIHVSMLPSEQALQQATQLCLIFSNSHSLNEAYPTSFVSSIFALSNYKQLLLLMSLAKYN